MLAEGWSKAGVEPAPIADDATYLRRVTLDITGRIPTPDAVQQFIGSAAQDKRRTLVEALLHSEAYAEHWAGVYTDLFLAGATKLRPKIAESTRAWLSGQFAAGTGYDTITTQVLTAQGTFEGPGPHGFVASHADKKNVEAVTGKTARVFLGITLECAQCHDHPSDARYSQRDFYAMAAFFARTQVKLKGGGGRSPTIVERPRGQMHLPTASDGPGEHNGPRIDPAFLGRAPQLDDTGRRAALAQAVVASDLFAKTVVARTWERLMGRGVVPRWDDLGGEADPSHPALLEHLAAQFVRHGHDHRALLRTLVLSDAYQRASWAPARDEASLRAAEATFAQATIRPMDADQLFRSLMVATDIERSTGRLFRKNVERRKRRALAEYRFVFSDDEMNSADAFSGSVPQALLLLNGDLVRHGATDVRGTTLHRVLDQHQDPADRVDALYLSVLGRPPSPPQRDRALAMLEHREHASSAYEDLMQAMLLSSEFLTIH